MTEKITFGYWGIRGLGQVSRLLLAYTGAVWEDVKYGAPEQWFGKDKQGLGIPFANLPYIIDGDFKLSESKAINLYIILRSDKKELLGKDIKDQARVESILGVLGDVRTQIAPLFWNPKYQEALPAALEKAEPKLKQLNEFYGNNTYALGYLTLADFQVSEFSYFVEKIAPEVYAKYPFLERVRTAFNALPEIQKYYESETAVKAPFVPPSAAIQF